MKSLKFTVLFISHLIFMFEAKPSNNIVQMPTNCETQNYCYEKIDDDYPQADIDRIVTALHIEAGDIRETEHRDGPDRGEDEEQPCLSTPPKINPIYYIRDTNGDVRYVAQNENFQQKIREVRCSDPGLMKEPRLPFQRVDVCRYNVTCVDELVPVKFLVLTHDRKNVEVATIKDGLPMACSCKYSYPEVRNLEECTANADVDDEAEDYYKQLLELSENE